MNCKNIAAIAALLALFSFKCFSQQEINTDFITQMNTAFAKLDKTKVPYGLLLDYAWEFADLPSYNGVLTDSNNVSPTVLRNIYMTVVMSAISTSAGNFYHPNYVDSIWQMQRKPGVLTLSGLFYNYSMFKSNAYTSGLITITNNQLIDKYVGTVWQNPYQTQQAFAMSPSINDYMGNNFQVVLPSNLWFTNSAATVSSIAINFNDGSGYRTIAKDMPITVSYADTGTKSWLFKLTTTTAVLYSQTQVQVLPDPITGVTGFNAHSSGSGGITTLGFPTNSAIVVPITATTAYNGAKASGTMSIQYANSDLKMRKPLIVVEGFDPAYLTAPELKYGYTNFKSFTNQLANFAASYNLYNLLQGSPQQYDIIYVDWNASADYLERNALLLETIINWVNNKKASDGVSTQPNVVLGQSMGAIISRYALKDMENQHIAHQTNLFISWDGPQQGANVPMAFQHLVRHAYDEYIQSALPLFQGLTSSTSPLRLARNSLTLIDQPAPREMLINCALDNGQTYNTLHTTWQQKLIAMGYPAQCRNIAVSNGSECGINQDFSPYADLININGNVHTTFLTDFLSQVVLPYIGTDASIAIAFLSQKPQFLLGALPGRNTVSFVLDAKAQPNGTSSQIYNCKISYQKKLLYVVSINTTLTNRTRNADASLIPIDGSPGGFYNTGIKIGSTDNGDIFYKEHIAISGYPQFNFIPTTSSLDIGSGNTTLQLADYNARYVGAAPPVAPLKSSFANFITAYDGGGTCVTYNCPTPSSCSCILSDNNEQHIEITQRNGDWVANQLNNILTPPQNCTFICSNSNFAITGSNPLCGTGVYSIQNYIASPNLTTTWSVDPTGIASLSCTSCAQTTLTQITPGQIMLTATLNVSGCGQILLNQQMSVGNALTGNISNTGQNTSMSTVNSVTAGATQVSFQWPGVTNLRCTQSSTNPSTSQTGFIFYSSNNTFWFTLSSGQSITVNFSGTGCGGPVSATRSFSVGGVTHYSVSPNPAGNTITVNFITQTNNLKTDLVTTTNSNTQIMILDVSGNIKQQQQISSNTTTVQMNVSNLLPGTYFVEIISGLNKEIHQIIINR
jgi:hypothetical protein